MAVTHEPMESREGRGVEIDHIHTYTVCLKCCL